MSCSAPFGVLLFRVHYKEPPNALKKPTVLLGGPVVPFTLFVWFKVSLTKKTNPKKCALVLRWLLGYQEFQTQQDLQNVRWNAPSSSSTPAYRDDTDDRGLSRTLGTSRQHHDPCGVFFLQKGAGHFLVLKQSSKFAQRIHAINTKP